LNLEAGDGEPRRGVGVVEGGGWRVEGGGWRWKEETEGSDCPGLRGGGIGG